MKLRVQFVLVAVGVFGLIAGGGALLFPDAISTLPVSIAALILCWPVAYWVTYGR